MNKEFKEFLKELSTLKAKGYEAFKNSKDMIRLRFRNQTKVFCPITAINHANTGTRVPMNMAHECKIGLGLTYGNLNNIVASSDYHYSYLWAKASTLRKSIIKSLGL